MRYIATPAISPASEPRPTLTRRLAHCAAVFGLILLASTGPLAAQDAPMSPASSTLAPDDVVRIQLGDAAGTWVRGRVAFLRGDSIFVAAGSSGARGYRWTEVERVERRVSKDSRAGLGILLGGLLGAGIGFGSEFCVLCTDSEEGRAALLGGVIGAGVGYAIGSAIRSDTWAVVAAPGASGITVGFEFRPGRDPLE